MDWFESITGFCEQRYEATQAKLSVVDGRLYSTSSDRTCAVGQFETPSLAELRQRTSGLTAGQGPSRVSCLQGDARELHGDAANANALFQVASQFNLLEMTSPSVSPEDGVTGYSGDDTQGPACAMAAGAGTIYRNYLVEVNGQLGQRADRQIDCLRDVGDALGDQNGQLWQMINGYLMVTDRGLAEVDRRLQALDDAQRDALKSRLRIGLHRDVEVTDAGAGHLVWQAYCSALPVRYNPVRHPQHWDMFATLVLEATYEATLLAAALNRADNKMPVVYLTRVGGGVFGNRAEWISSAIGKAVATCQDAALDIRIVSLSAPSQEMVGLVQRWNDAVGKAVPGVVSVRGNSR